jgi:transposase InsO family protein
MFKYPRRKHLVPRFFERATPNQMWQSDIFTFRLGARYPYVIAFLDDYSRYVVGSETVQVISHDRQRGRLLGHGCGGRAQQHEGTR